MKSSLRLSSAIMLLACLCAATAFTSPKLPVIATRSRVSQTTPPLFGFLGDKERDGLTRDSEPDQFFSTNTDKMTDAEKLPIALAGIAFITVPFIAGLIALYASK
ncbi:hypothetical protein MPSEU_000235400 [Mayamaea pseudoterrestris]|nr:hypothetical protein MPSEU_000235400 [Mayamaea pseudoterrestris]